MVPSPVRSIDARCSGCWKPNNLQMHALILWRMAMGKNGLNRMLWISTLLLGVSTVSLAYVAIKQHQQIRVIRESDVSGKGGIEPVSDALTGNAANAIQGTPDQGQQLKDEERRIYENEIHRLKSQLGVIQAELYSPIDGPSANNEYPAESSFNGMLADYAAAMNDPEVRNFRRAEKRTQIGRTYQSLFKGLELSAGEFEAFKELLVEESMAREDIRLEMGASASADRRKEEVARMTRLIEGYTDKIRSSLGEYNYEVYREWEETLYDRTQVDYFSQSLEGEDQIDEEQEHDLISAMYEERTSFVSTTGADQADQQQPFDPSEIAEEELAEEMDELTQLHENYVARAQDILSEYQMAQFVEMLEQQRATVEKTSRMMMLVGAAHENAE